MTCVPPFPSQDLVVYLLKNIMKGFLATFIGFPFLNICGQKTIKPQVNKAILYSRKILKINLLC